MLIITDFMSQIGREKVGPLQHLHGNAVPEALGSPKDVSNTFYMSEKARKPI